MLEHFFSLMASFRAIIYSAICLSSILVFASYRKAYYKVKRTWIIQSVMHLFFALGFSFFFYTIASLVNLVEGVGLRYRFLVALIGFVNIPLLLAIINFWNASLNQNDQKNGYEGEYTKVFYTARETAKKLKMNYLKVIAICKKLGIRKDHSGFEIIKEDLKKIKSLI